MISIAGVSSRHNSLKGAFSKALCQIASAGIPTAISLSIICAAPLSASAQTTLTVAKVADDFALMMGDYGNELGIFKKHGLDVQIPLITQAKMVQAMIAGSVDMALGSGSAIAFAAKGAPFKAVAAIDGPPKLLVLVVPPHSKIKTVDDLKGSTVAATNKGALTDWAVSQIAERKGWKLSDIKRAYIGDTPARVAAIRAGVADAAVMDIATALELEQRGEGKILVNFGDLIKNFQNQIIYASDLAIKTKPNAVREFVAGFFETLKYARAHPKETVAFTQKQLNVSHEVAQKVYDQLMKPGFFSANGRIKLKTLQSMSKSFVELKLLDHEANLSSDFDQNFLPQTK